MKVLAKGSSVVLGSLLLLAGLGLAVVFRGQAEATVGAVLMGSGVLLVGFGFGFGAALASGLGVFLSTSFLWGRSWLDADGALASMAMSAVGILLPLAFSELGREEEGRFETLLAPLAADRDALRGKLVELQAQSKIVERQGRETDALFHAGREISKLLTLADTLEFSREVLHDTLKPTGGSPVPAFVLALVDEDRSSTHIGIAEGVDESAAELLPQGGGFYRWLKAGSGLCFVPSVAAETGLKGVPLPAGVRSLLSVPLTIQEQAIGWVVVFDTGEGGFPDGDFSNLKILCSQIAIGLEKAMLYDRVQRLSVTDGLTGLTVHRHFQSRLDEELKRSERYREPLSLIMADIDHFKYFNDTWGHLAGDAVLKAVAAVFKAGLGASEMAVRYGGEEFVLVLPKYGKDAALSRAEDLRQAVKGLKVAAADPQSKSMHVTISLGVATYPDDAMTKSGLVDMADAALYQSKKGGRDRVTGSKPGAP